MPHLTALKVKPEIDGMFVCYKPPGMVSKDVSRKITRCYGKVKIGHVGTLDPLAEGVLPILLGKATRLQDYLLENKKTYEFEVELGKATDTCDSDGNIVETRPYAGVVRSEVEKICEVLTGLFDQVPPIYSAIKFKGKPLYQYAREGKESEICLDEFKKKVEIYSLKVLDFALPIIRFEMVCQKGTYVRSVATKISEMLNTCGMVTRLIRTAGSGITIDQAHLLDDIEQCWERFSDFVIPLSKINLNLPSWYVGDDSVVKRLTHGQRIAFEEVSFQQNLRLPENADRDKIHTEDKFLLRDQQGEVFGIGSSHRSGDGRVTAFLHRGL